MLLVEDNVINQRVARRFLERLGCEVQMVGDGAQAVDAFRAQSYWLHSDGHADAGHGRPRRPRGAFGKSKASTPTDEPRTPIVALTADAMLGTLERCLEAGMDDYLTKPLDILRLQAALDRFMGAVGAPPMTASPPQPGATDNAIGARLAAIAGGDAQFVSELIHTFIASSGAILQEMRAAVSRDDLMALGSAAHKLKGASANLQIDSLAAFALDIELRAKAGQEHDWHQSLDHLMAELRARGRNPAPARRRRRQDCCVEGSNRTPSPTGTETTGTGTEPLRPCISSQRNAWPRLAFRRD